MVFIKDVTVNGQSRFAELLDGVASGRLTAASVKISSTCRSAKGSSVPESAAMLVSAFTTSSRKRCWPSKWAKGTIKAVPALRLCRKFEKQLFDLYKIKPEREAEKERTARWSDLFRRGVRSDQRHLQ